jgi:diadenosine tetraphosphate (Ap4A) HIT family hydrolase
MSSHELHSRGICLILRAYHANERLSLVRRVRITHDARYCNSVKMTSNECFTCQSISGEKRISPGPTIHEGDFWLVEHAYPCRLKGWLVLVLKRHVEALHELSQGEFRELADLQHKLARLLRDELDCEKEHSICLAEAEHFHHIHFHLVPKPKNLPDELRATRIFAMLHPEETDAIPPDEIRKLCHHLKARFEQVGHD